MEMYGAAARNTETRRCCDYETMGASPRPREAQMGEPMIRAEVRTDDDRFHASFDATPYFEEAVVADLVALRAAGWSGNQHVDAVALYMLEKDEEVTDLFHYLAFDPVMEDDWPVGFECSVSEGDVVRWVLENRPGWYERVWMGDCQSARVEARLREYIAALRGSRRQRLSRV
jgi:hypothetical protein